MLSFASITKLWILTNSSTNRFNPPVLPQVSKTIWQTSLPATNYATLCPGMQRLPRVGTFAAEILSAGAFLLKWLVKVCVYTPGMIPIWKDGGNCPAQGAAYRHSVLQNCGQDLFSLEDFFDSLDDAGAVFWHSLSIVASDLNSQQSTNPFSDILNGMSQYGQGSVDLWAARQGVITLTKIPIAEQLKSVLAVVNGGPGSVAAAVSSGFQISAGSIAWARFYFKTLSDIALTLTKALLNANAVTSQVTLAFPLFYSEFKPGFAGRLAHPLDAALRHADLLRQHHYGQASTGLRGHQAHAGLRQPLGCAGLLVLHSRR